jgi:hypothetical protein
MHGSGIVTDSGAIVISGQLTQARCDFLAVVSRPENFA